MNTPRWSTDEATAFAHAARSVDADAATACPGWTAHDVLAHAVAGGVEIGRLAGLHLDGADVGPTMSFEDREPVFRAVRYTDLIDLVDGGGIFELLAMLEDRTNGAPIPFTGWDMDADTLALHVRSELAIHRWDLVGSDPTADELLAQPELTAHAVRSLNHFDVIDERATVRTIAALDSADDIIDARLRVIDQPDVVIRASVRRTELCLDEPIGDATITTDAATRLLLLWGRQPPMSECVTSALAADENRPLQRWLFPPSV